MSIIDEQEPQGKSSSGVAELGSQPHVAFTKDLFNGIAGSYDSWAQILTFFQYLRWRRVLVSQMNLLPDSQVLDASTGTAGVAMEIARRDGNSRIIGLDVTPSMLEMASRALEKHKLNSRIKLIEGSAEKIPFSDETFDVVVSSYLLRYVKDPHATIGELSRVLKPGGQMLSLEFGVPSNHVIHALWQLYMRGLMPVVALPASHGWHRAARFLGPSISRFCQAHPLTQLEQSWRDQGFIDVQTSHLMGGVALVMRGKKR
ncbi:MAG: class I SAM-dependent methyltransferase [Chloroflexi bacterium]|nr:class I SAM-dependent methyltransferase [Chloroflexota bacterium]